MKITISDSKGDSISITIGNNGSFQALKKPLEKGHEMHMDFSNSENKEKHSTDLVNPTNQDTISSLNYLEKSVDSSNLQLLEDQVKSCLNQIRIEPGIGSRIKEPDIEVSISQENNKILKYESFCRLCANQANDMVYMFETNGRYKNIVDKIEDCLPIVITETDALPKEACLSCLEKLELCYKFHKTVAKAEKHFLASDARISHDSIKITKCCQTISKDSGTTNLNPGEENSGHFDVPLVPQTILSTCNSAPNSPIYIADSEDESSLAERMADSKNKGVGNDRTKAKREDEKAEKNPTGRNTDWKIIECQICGEGFHTIRKCYTHSKSHITDNYYPCSFCGEIFTVEKDWSEHSMEHVAESESGKGADSYPCDKCGKKFITEAKLEFHKNYRNADPKLCYCKPCNTVLNSEPALYQHLQTAHGQCKEFRCDVCGKQFRAQASVNAHQRKHRYIRSFECSVCHKRFYSKDTLEMHKETHSNEKNFSCVYCGKLFAQKLPLTVHILSHTEDSNPNKKTANVSKSEKDIHRKTDTANRPFKCLVCERTFDHSARLREHSSVHTGKRPYSCSLCDKSFKRANARKVHMIIHTGEKPHRCDTCGTHFRRAGDMRRHKKTQHGQNE